MLSSPLFCTLLTLVSPETTTPSPPVTVRFCTVPLPSTLSLSAAEVILDTAAAAFTVTAAASAVSCTVRLLTEPDTSTFVLGAATFNVPTLAPSATLTWAPAAVSGTSTLPALPATSTAASVFSTIRVPTSPSILTSSEPSSTVMISTSAPSSTATRSLPSLRFTSTVPSLDFPLMTTECSPPPRRTRLPSTVTPSSVTSPLPTPSAMIRLPLTAISLSTAPAAFTITDFSESF